MEPFTLSAYWHSSHVSGAKLQVPLQQAIAKLLRVTKTRKCVLTSAHSSTESIYEEQSVKRNPIYYREFIASSFIDLSFKRPRGLMHNIVY